MEKKRLPKEYCNLEFNQTVARWDEAIPLGNGLCGALIWGGSRALRFSLDRNDIWDNTPFPGIQSPDFRYARMVELARKGDEAGIREIFDAPYNHPVPTKLPAGKIIVDLGVEENVVSHLSLAEATAVITAGGVRAESFLHAQKGIGILRINRPLSGIGIAVQNPEYGVAGEEPANSAEIDSVQTASLKILRYPLPDIVDTEREKYFVQAIDDTFSYGIFLKLAERDGQTLAAFAVGTSHDGADWIAEIRSSLEGVLAQGYDEFRKEHLLWWEEYWSRSSLSLPNRYYEKMWYLANYLLASCSREGHFPMPLQGVWTADDGGLPPWKGDYHHDLNTQLSYYSYLKANHLPEGKCFLDYLWSLKPVAEQFARSFYGVDEGLCLPAVMTQKGEALGGWGMYSLSPVNQIWLCQAFERYWKATGDREFLQQRAYPYFKGTAQMILGLLEERDGLYYLPVSSSSEIHDDTIDSFLTPNSNYDLSLMRYLFGTLAEMASELELKEGEEWRQALGKLPPLAVNSRGVLMLSPDEELLESHRHFSHLMAIHPLRLLSYDRPEDRRIIDASIHNLEILGTGYWCGYSFAWMAELYALQRNGNGAAYQLRVFWENTCSQNGFHLNGDYKKRGTSQFHYRPFTLEGNFCAADALQEMLLQSEGNHLRLFPAIPEEWKTGTVSFEDFRAEQGLLVSAEMRDGEIVSLTLKPEKDCAVLVENFSGLSKESRLLLKAGQAYCYQK